MDRLKFGERELLGSVRQTGVWMDGRHASALELVVSGGVTQEDLEAMTGFPLEIIGEDGQTQGVHRGYGILFRHSVVLVKKDEARQKLEETESALMRAEEENAELLYRLLTGEAAE